MTKGGTHTSILYFQQILPWKSPDEDHFSWLHHSHLTQHINSVNPHSLSCNPSNTTQDVSHANCLFGGVVHLKSTFISWFFCPPHLPLGCINMIWFMLLMTHWWMLEVTVRFSSPVFGILSLVSKSKLLSCDFGCLSYTAVRLLSNSYVMTDMFLFCGNFHNLFLCKSKKSAL